jgi:hypothetical protein
MVSGFNLFFTNCACLRACSALARCSSEGRGFRAVGSPAGGSFEGGDLEVEAWRWEQALGLCNEDFARFDESSAYGALKVHSNRCG